MSGEGQVSPDDRMRKRGEIIRLWFDMWLRQENLGIDEVFAEDADYIESWGPEYHGREKIAHWFAEWNTRGRVVQWDIVQCIHTQTQTAVQWVFRNEMKDGTVQAFEGMSLIRWTHEATIACLQEFGCNMDRYDPYQKGDVPQFRDEGAMWF